MAIVNVNSGENEPTSKRWWLGETRQNPSFPVKSWSLVFWFLWAFDRPIFSNFILKNECFLCQFSFKNLCIKLGSVHTHPDIFEWANVFCRFALRPHDLHVDRKFRIRQKNLQIKKYRNMCEGKTYGFATAFQFSPFCYCSPYTQQNCLHLRCTRYNIVWPTADNLDVPSWQSWWLACNGQSPPDTIGSVCYTAHTRPPAENLSDGSAIDHCAVQDHHGMKRLKVECYVCGHFAFLMPCHILGLREK